VANEAEVSNIGPSPEWATTAGHAGGMVA
jgi:hypothetical protein